MRGRPAKTGLQPSEQLCGDREYVYRRNQLISMASIRGIPKATDTAPVRGHQHLIDQGISRYYGPDSQGRGAYVMEHVLVSDNDGHWYVIPAKQITSFAGWLMIDPDDEASWSHPHYAEPVGGSPSLVRFKEYRIE